MSCIAIAILGHALNAVAFIVDKILLSVAFKKSASYATMIGCLSFLAVLVIPWVHTWPGLHLLPVIVAFGGLFVLALWAFFEALKHGEASRVVPLVGSSIPVCTLIGSLLILHQGLSAWQGIGFLFLLVATGLLASGSSKHALTRESLFFSLLAAGLFALSSVCGKYAFDHGDFLGIFLISRLAAGITGMVIGLSVPGVVYELWTMGGQPRSKKGSKERRHLPEFSPRVTRLLAIFGQVCGALGFVGVTIALSRGNASLVNALQATQYAFIVLVGWFGTKRIRALLKEDRQPKTMMLKTLAILCVGTGLACLVRGS